MWKIGDQLFFEFSFLISEFLNSHKSQDYILKVIFQLITPKMVVKIELIFKEMIFMVEIIKVSNLVQIVNQNLSLLDHVIQVLR